MIYNCVHLNYVISVIVTDLIIAVPVLTTPALDCEQLEFYCEATEKCRSCVLCVKPKYDPDFCRRNCPPDFLAYVNPSTTIIQPVVKTEGVILDIRTGVAVQDVASALMIVSIVVLGVFLLGVMLYLGVWKLRTYPCFDSKRSMFCGTNAPPVKEVTPALACQIQTSLITRTEIPEVVIEPAIPQYLEITPYCSDLHDSDRLSFTDSLLEMDITTRNAALQNMQEQQDHHHQDSRDSPSISIGYDFRLGSRRSSADITESGLPTTAGQAVDGDTASQQAAVNVMPLTDIADEDQHCSMSMSIASICSSDYDTSVPDQTIWPSKLPEKLFRKLSSLGNVNVKLVPDRYNRLMLEICYHGDNVTSARQRINDQTGLEDHDYTLRLIR